MRTGIKHNQFHCFPLLCLLALSACSKNIPPAASTPPPDHIRITDPRDAVETLEKVAAKDPCEQKVAPIRKEIQEKILAWEEQIKASPPPLKEKEKDSETLYQVPFQNSFLSEYPVGLVPKVGWNQMKFSWEGLKKWLDSNANKHDVRVLHEGVSSKWLSLLSEDQQRLVVGKNYSIGHEQIEFVKSLIESVKICHSDPDCLEINPGEEIKAQAMKIPLYRNLFAAVQNAKDRESKRAAILMFANRAYSDEFQFTYRSVTPLHSRKGMAQTTFTLNLNPGALREPEKEIFEKAAIASWQNHSAKLNIEWVDQAMNLFTILFHINFPGARANVSYGDNTLNLYPGTHLKGIAHEVGHLLGFPDHYYTVWDEETCSYTQYSNTDDLMSNHLSGTVTEEEWKMLMDALGRSSPDESSVVQ